MTPISYTYGFFQLLLFVLFIWSGPGIAFAGDICKEKRLTGELYTTCDVLCNKLQCREQDTYHTSGGCVFYLDQFLKQSSNEMPPCLHRFRDATEYWPNELNYYANYTLDLKEQCQPLFDSSLDRPRLIDEKDGMTKYESCLAGLKHRFESSMFHLQLEIYSSCKQTIGAHCFEQFELPEQYLEFAPCIEQVQQKIDICYIDMVGKLKFQSLPFNYLDWR